MACFYDVLVFFNLYGLDLQNNIFVRNCDIKLKQAAGRESAPLSP